MEITKIAGSNAIMPENNKRGGASKTGAKPEDTDFTVQISSKASQITSASALTDEARQAKVAAIREQLASGEYNISGKDVAAKILNLLKV